MVQVDVFWSYAIGAGFSLAAYRQVQQLSNSPSVSAAPANAGSGGEAFGKRGPFENMYFIKSLLYLALLFAPSGIYLLWAFPSWETMHVGSYETIPPWLVAAFAITNVTQGILGFWVTHKLISLKKHYAAFLQPFLGYFCMFFILVNGWDKIGYQRFLSATRDDFLNWDWSVGLAWFSSEVALTLGAMGVVLIPVMLCMITKWIRAGYAIGENVDQERAAKMGPLKLIVLFLLLVFGGCLGFAVVATLLISQLGWLAGLLVFAVIFYLCGLGKFGIFRLAHSFQLMEKRLSKTADSV